VSICRAAVDCVELGRLVYVMSGTVFRFYVTSFMYKTGHGYLSTRNVDVDLDARFDHLVGLEQWALQAD